MSPRGRKPNVLTQRSGSSHNPQPDVSVLAVGALQEHIDPPDILTEEAHPYWVIMSDALVDARVLREEHIPMLIEACEAFALAAATREQLWDAIKSGEEPKYVGKLRTNYVSISGLAKGYAAEIGISPVAQVRLGLLKAQGSSILDALDKRPSTNKE
jgi:hypothetical protein